MNHDYLFHFCILNLGQTNYLQCDWSFLVNAEGQVQVPYTADKLAEIALGDKKRNGGKINLIVPFGIGNSRIHEIDVSDLEDFFAKGL